MSAGKREDYCLVLCATYDGECRARGRGIGAQERDDPATYPWSCGGASRSCSRTRRPTMTLYREAKLGRDFFPGDRAGLIAAANLFQ